MKVINTKIKEKKLKMIEGVDYSRKKKVCA